MSVEPPLPPPERPPRNARGYRVAATRSILAFVLLLLAAEVIAFLSAADAPDGVSFLDTLEIGALTFFGFHHVGIGVDVPPLDLGELVPGAGMGGALPFEFGFSASVSVAMLLATAAAVWLLYRAGRGAASAGGGNLRDRVLLGASVAVPYAALSLLLALLVKFRIEAPSGPGSPFNPGTSLEIGASPLAAFLWPLVLGGIAGALGGLAAARDLLGETDRLRWTTVVLGGTARMLGVAALVGGSVLAVLSLANPSVFVEYWRGVGEAGVRGGFLLILFTALLTPNFIVVLAYLGMGAGIVAGDYVGTNTVTLLTLVNFPTGASLPEGLGPDAGIGLGPGGFPLPFQAGAAPPEWWVSILIPLVAVLWGGRWAARRAATTRGEGAFLGAAAGVVFAVLLVGLAILAGVGFRLDLSFGLQASNVGRVGPSILFGTLLAGAWGGVGGALGGLLARPSRHPELAAPPPPPSPPPPP